MEFLLIIFVIFLLLVGLIGSFIPAIPGPSVSYISLLVFHFFTSYEISTANLLICTLIAILVTIFDFWIQIHGVKKFGGEKKAVNGSIVGLILGLLFLPGIGIIIGPLLGAFVGAQMEAKKFNDAIKIAFGAFVGFIVGTFSKFSFSIYIIYIIINSFNYTW